MPGCEEEARGGIAPEVVTQDVEGPGRVTEGGGDLRTGAAFDKVGAERLVLALLGGGGFEEEAADVTYVFRFAYRHDVTVSHTISCVNLDFGLKRWCLCQSSINTGIVLLLRLRVEGFLDRRVTPSDMRYRSTILLITPSIDSST